MAQLIEKKRLVGILRWFDFAKVQRVMEQTDAKWLREDGRNEVPSIYDTVVTHTAPSFCEFTMPPGVVDSEELLADMQEERRVMDGLLDCLRHDGHPLRRWFYGHFHHSWNAEIDGIRYTMLGIMEMKELR